MRELEERAGDKIEVHPYSEADFLRKGLLWFLLIFPLLKSLKLSWAVFKWPTEQLDERSSCTFPQELPARSSKAQMNP